MIKTMINFMKTKTDVLELIKYVKQEILQRLFTISIIKQLLRKILKEGDRHLISENWTIKKIELLNLSKKQSRELITQNQKKGNKDKMKRMKKMKILLCQMKMTIADLDQVIETTFLKSNWMLQDLNQRMLEYKEKDRIKNKKCF